MSAGAAVDELCALGFEKFWVNQALELTNQDKECALEWLLSDEFQLAQQQYNAEQAAAKKKKSKKRKKSSKSIKKRRQKEIEIEVEYEHKDNKQMEIEIEYDLNDNNDTTAHLSDNDTNTANKKRHPQLNISSNKSLEYTGATVKKENEKLLVPSMKNNNSDNNNTSAAFKKFDTTIVHGTDDSVDYSGEEEDEDSDDGLNMEYLDEMSMGNQSMDMSSMDGSMGGSFGGSMGAFGLRDIIDSEFIDSAPKLIYRELKHLRHTYITPLYYGNMNKFIVSTKTFNNKNDLLPGIWVYNIGTNEWKELAKYPTMFNFQSHQHVLDINKNLLYIYNNNFEDGLFIIYDIKNNKFRGIKRNLYRGNRVNQPRMYQAICSIYIPSPINELHFIANTNTHSNHFKYDTINNKINQIEMCGLDKNYVMNPKVLYVPNLQRLYSFGGYNGSLHRDVSFLQYNNILYCDIKGDNKKIKKQCKYEWVNSSNRLPFKSSIFDVCLCFDTILIFFYGKVMYLFDLNLHMDDKKWYKCQSVYPLNECYDLMIIFDQKKKNIHFIHCTNPLGLSLMGGNNFNRHPSVSSAAGADKPYHIKINVFDVIPKELFDKYKIKFPLCLQGIIRNLLNKVRLNTTFNDIPNDIFNIILAYFHPLCLAKRK